MTKVMLSVESSQSEEWAASVGMFRSTPATMRLVVEDIGITAHYHRNDGFYCRFKFHDLCDLINRGCIMPDLGMAFNMSEVHAAVSSRQ